MYRENERLKARVLWNRRKYVKFSVKLVIPAVSHRLLAVATFTKANVSMVLNLRSMNTWKRILAITTVFAMGACADGLDDSGFYIYNYSADFRDGMDDWWGDFADYPVGQDDSLNYE